MRKKPRAGGKLGMARYLQKLSLGFIFLKRREERKWIWPDKERQVEGLREVEVEVVINVPCKVAAVPGQETSS